MGYTRVPSLLLCLFLGACGTVDRRVDPDADDSVGGAVLQSQDIRTMADRMARAIIDRGVLESADPTRPITFHITELQNQSSDTINTQIVLTKLRTELSKGLGSRVVILDRSQSGLEELRAERAAKRADAVSANPEMTGNVLGSDYVLKGTIMDRVQQSRDMISAYYLVTFELVDLETGALTWTDDYEAKFESEKSVISR